MLELCLVEHCQSCNSSTVLQTISKHRLILWHILSCPLLLLLLLSLLLPLPLLLPCHLLLLLL